MTYLSYGLAASCAYTGRLAAFLLYEILRDPSLRDQIAGEVDCAFAGGIGGAAEVRRMRILRSAYDETLRVQATLVAYMRHRVLPIGVRRAA